MKRRLGYVAVGALLTALCLVSTTGFSQQGNDSEVLHSGYGNVHVLPPGGPAPRTADGHPDLSGVWYPNKAGIAMMPNDPVDPDAKRQFDPKLTPEEKPELQPWALAKIKAMNASDPTERALAEESLNCAPEGVPGMFLMSPPHPGPIKLVQTHGELVQLQEFLNNFRVVPLDGRPHQKDPDPTYTGDAVGHWEGDTLVIDVIGLDERSKAFFKPKAFLGKDWEFFHSDQEHVIEHLSRRSMNDLVYQVTIEDPKVLVKPWNSAPRHWSLSRYNEPLLEWYCTNDQDTKEIQAVQQQAAEGKKSK